MNFDPPQNLILQNSPVPENPDQNIQNPSNPEPVNESATKMEIEPSPSKVNPSKIESDLTGKQSPMKMVKPSPNKQEVSNFNQPEEHITIIFSSFKDAIRTADLPRLKEILRKPEK